MTLVRLERFERRHLHILDQLTADPEVLRFTRFPVPCPPDFAEEWWSRLISARGDGTSEAFAILDESAGVVLGLAGAPRIDAAARTAELGYVVAPIARGQGVATQALTELTDWGLSGLQALRLELHISVENEPSRRVAARCGYVCEGVLRSLFLKDTIRVDTEIWSRLPTDP